MKLYEVPGQSTAISPFDFANLFNIYPDANLPKQTDYSYSINRTLIFKNILKTVAPAYFWTYTPKRSDSWMLISYNLYGRTDLWWLILKVNEIADPMVEPYEFQSLRILKKDYINNILTSIRAG